MLNPENQKMKIKGILIVCLSLVLILLFSSLVIANQRFQLGASPDEKYNIEYEIIPLDLNNLNRSSGLILHYLKNNDYQLNFFNRRYLFQETFYGPYFNPLIGISSIENDLDISIGINIGYKNVLGKDLIYDIKYFLIYLIGDDLQSKSSLMIGYAW